MKQVFDNPVVAFEAHEARKAYLTRTTKAYLRIDDLLEFHGAILVGTFWLDALVSAKLSRIDGVIEIEEIDYKNIPLFANDNINQMIEEELALIAIEYAKKVNESRWTY